MKVPLSWLREMVDVPETPEALGRRLTLAGLEVEGIDEIGQDWAPETVVVALIEAVEPHPNADRLRLVTVNRGDSRITVVTGAPNVRPGQKVIFGGLGTRYIDNHDPARKVTTLKKGVIRGVASEGMVMSEAELGLSDEHEGIIELPDDAPVGQPARDYLGDAVLDLEITPNLVHNFSIAGVAREVGALYDRVTRLPAPRLADWHQVDPGLVTIEAPDQCARFVAAVVRGVRVAPSPRWLQHRLRLAGLRPINNLVDVTNYVMLELGQPMHAFDLHRLRGERVVVRRAQPGEQLETLDHEQRQLDGEMIVVADAERAVSVAGIIGGVDSEITNETVDIVLEAATWEMRNIRRTRRLLRVRTDASSRFERGLDPELALPAVQRAVELVLQLSPGARLDCYHDNYPRPPQPVEIDFSLSEIERLLGVAHPAATADAVLQRLGFGLAPTGPERRRVTVPSWRSDVRIPADLVEEVARVIGYERLPDTLPATAIPPVARDARLLFEEGLRDSLVGLGLFEIIGYSWTSAEELDRLAGGAYWSDDLPGDRPLLEIVNPLRPESRLMRPTLLATMLATLADNRQRRERVALFEVASVYLPTAPDQLPTERRTLAIGLAGFRHQRSAYEPLQPVDFFDLKGIVETLLSRLGLTGDYRPSGPETLHPGRRAELVLDDRVVGVLGELHPGLAASWNLEEQRVVLAEINLDLIRTALTEQRRFRPISRTQTVVQDLAVIVDANTPVAAVKTVIEEAVPYLLQRVRLFDVYTGAPIPAGMKSLAFEIALQARDRDLPEAEIEKARGRIEQRLKKELGASLRS